MKSIISDKVPIITIVFFAFCVALFFCVLQNIIFGRVGRYLPLSREPISYIDTATGAVYRPNGQFIGRPDRCEAFWALWGLGEKSRKRALKQAQISHGKTVGDGGKLATMIAELEAPPTSQSSSTIP